MRVWLKIAMGLVALGMLIFAVACSDEAGEATVGDSPCRAAFTYVAEADDTPVRVALVGDFNGWSPEGWDLAASDDGKNWTGDFALGGGRYLYRLFVDGVEIMDPQNPLSLYGSDGREHSLWIQPDCTQPALEIKRAQADAAGYTVEAAFNAAADGMDVDDGSLELLLDGKPVTGGVTWDGTTLTVQVNAEKGKHRLSVQVADSAGRETQKHLLPFWVEDESFDWKDAVIYQIVTDRFKKGDGPLDEARGMTARMGGDLAGIREKLTDGYFDTLGINTLWISPAYTNADGWWAGFDGREYESYHGYWPIAPQQVEPRIGGAQALEALVDAAHAKGMRLIVDVVMNHVHSDHIYFTEHRAEWFNHPAGDCVCGRECSWGADIEHCWFTDYLPDLDWTNHTVVDTLTSDTAWWIERFDVDGLRLDAVAMMPRLSTRMLRHEVGRRYEQGGTHVYLIGENFTGAGGAGRQEIRRALGPYGLSAQFDFPLMWAIRSVIGQGQGSMADLLDEARASEDAWEGSGAVMGLIVGNHDVPRFLSVAAGDDVSDPQNGPDRPMDDTAYRKLALAYAFLFSLPGAPIVYYGDEYGMPGAGDPDNRRPMRFDEARSEHERALFAKVAKLGRLRGAVRALRRGLRQKLVVRSDVLAYLLTTDDDVAVVVLNRGDSASRIEIELPETLPMPQVTGLADCFGQTIERDGRRMSFVMPPKEFSILVNSEVCDAIE